jgi:hypothetical protein
MQPIYDHPYMLAILFWLACGSLAALGCFILRFAVRQDLPYAVSGLATWLAIIAHFLLGPIGVLHFLVILFE